MYYECSRYLNHLKGIKLLPFYSPLFILAEAINYLLEKKLHNKVDTGT